MCELHLRPELEMKTRPKELLGSLAAPKHRHLSNIDCLMAHIAFLVCFISTFNCRSKKGKEMEPFKTGTCSGRITNLKQSILQTFDIYAPNQD